MIRLIDQPINLKLVDSNLEFESWIDLMELYHKIYDTDQVQGVLLKVMKSEERKQFTDILNLKKKGLVNEAKRTIESLLETCANYRLKSII